MNSLTLSQWGLIFDLIGVLLLFRYGLPSKIESENGPSLAAGLEGDDLKKVKRDNLIIKIGANLGLGLIFLGFVLQFIGSSKKC